MGHQTHPHPQIHVRQRDVPRAWLDPTFPAQPHPSRRSQLAPEPSRSRGRAALFAEKVAFLTAKAAQFFPSFFRDQQKTWEEFWEPERCQEGAEPAANTPHCGTGSWGGSPGLAPAPASLEEQEDGMKRHGMIPARCCSLENLREEDEAECSGVASPPNN